MPNTCFVVLNWNGLSDTQNLVASLGPVTGPDDTILVVDNASEDGSERALRETHPDLPVLQTGANLGYAGGNNAGIGWALERGFEFICVLNNDTLVDSPDFARELQRAAETGAIVSPTIVREDNRELWFAGAVVDERYALPRHLSPEEVADVPVHDGYRQSQLLTGCCLFARATTWQRVGFIDERYFLLFEDSDWSLHAASLGVELLVAERSVLLHRVSKSFRYQARFSWVYYYCRNGTLFAGRHRGLRGALRFVLTCALRPRLGALAHGFDREKAAALVTAMIGVLAAATARTGKLHGYDERLVARLQAATSQVVPA